MESTATSAKDYEQDEEQVEMETNLNSEEEEDSEEEEEENSDSDSCCSVMSWKSQRGLISELQADAKFYRKRIDHLKQENVSLKERVAALEKLLSDTAKSNM